MPFNLQVLQQFVKRNYSIGGHYVYDSYSEKEYAAVLAEANNNVERACEKLREIWTSMQFRVSQANK